MIKLAAFTFQYLKQKCSCRLNTNRQKNYAIFCWWPGTDRQNRKPYMFFLLFPKNWDSFIQKKFWHSFMIFLSHRTWNQRTGNFFMSVTCDREWILDLVAINFLVDAGGFFCRCSTDREIGPLIEKLFDRQGFFYFFVALVLSVFSCRYRKIDFCIFLSVLPRQGNFGFQ
jgi:hypothetical protein